MMSRGKSKEDDQDGNLMDRETDCKYEILNLEI